MQPCDNWRSGLWFTALEHPSRSCRGHPQCHAPDLFQRPLLTTYLQWKCMCVCVACVHTHVLCVGGSCVLHACLYVCVCARIHVSCMQNVCVCVCCMCGYVWLCICVCARVTCMCGCVTYGVSDGRMKQYIHNFQPEVTTSDPPGKRTFLYRWYRSSS